MNDSPPSPKRFSAVQVLLFVIAGIVGSAAITTYVFVSEVFVSEFKPVTLSAKEETRLNQKIEQLLPGSTTSDAIEHSDTPAPLEPEPYSEEGASRDIALSEKELNAIIAKNTDLARKLAIDLSDDLASAKLLIPLEEDFPFFGGQTLKVTAGLALAYRDEQPSVMIEGVSIWGVPIPNAWLGGLKNVDLIEQYGNQEGFWSSLAAGVDYVKVEERRLKIVLKE